MSEKQWSRGKILSDDGQGKYVQEGMVSWQS